MEIRKMENYKCHHSTAKTQSFKAESFEREMFGWRPTTLKKKRNPKKETSFATKPHHSHNTAKPLVLTNLAENHSPNLPCKTSLECRLIPTTSKIVKNILFYASNSFPQVLPL